MKTPQTYKFILVILIFTISGSHGFSQMRIELNGAKVVLANGTYLVIDNPSANAITRNSGHIISEGESNILKWNMGTNTGSYIIPFGYSSDYIPVSFTKSAGTGTGSISFSTYHTGWQNSASLPAGVGNVDRNGIDNSPYVIDRFWQIHAENYTSKPDLDDLTFTYLDAEHSASGNSITENELGIQRWNSDIIDWADYIPAVNINTTFNTVSVNTVIGTDLYRWWTLPSTHPLHTLPVELTEFKGSCENETKVLTWTTASEMNSSTFTLESSTDAANWSTVMTIPAAGNSNRIQQYSATDRISTGNELYYRLKQTDYNGQSEYSAIIRISCDNNPTVAALEIYPNPSTGLFYLRNIPSGALVEVSNARGEVAYSNQFFNTEESIDLQGMSKGMYFVTVRNGQKASTTKLMVQ